MVEDFWDRFAMWLLVASIGLGLLSTAGIVGWQIFTWLRTGAWIPLPLHAVLEYLGSDLTPIYNPSDWYGLAVLARWLLDLPLALWVPVAVISAALAWKAFVSSN